MSEPEKSTPSPEDQAAKPEKRQNKITVDDKYKWSDNPEENEVMITTIPAFAAKKELKGVPKIKSQWPKVLEACRLGYELTAICKALGLHMRVLQRYLQHNPDKRREIIEAQNSPRDECVNAVLNAARKGQWVAAAWFLERTRGMEFAKPEVKLQYWDRMMSQDQVEQKIAGRTIDELRDEFTKELKEHKKIEQQYFRNDAPGLGSSQSGKDGSNNAVQPAEKKEGPEAGS